MRLLRAKDVFYLLVCFYLYSCTENVNKPEFWTNDKNIVFDYFFLDNIDETRCIVVNALDSIDNF